MVPAIVLREGDWVRLAPGEEPVRLGRVVWVPDNPAAPVRAVEAPAGGILRSWAPAERVAVVQASACRDDIPT